MDKLISSLLCCSVDSKDDTNDRVVNQQHQQHKKHPNSISPKLSNVVSSTSHSKTILLPTKSTVKVNSKSSGTASKSDGKSADRAGSERVSNDRSGAGASVTGATTGTSTTTTSNSGVVQRKSDSKEIEEEENSVNETDTITNNNDETETKTPSALNGGIHSNEQILEAEQEIQSKDLELYENDIDAELAKNLKQPDHNHKYLNGSDANGNSSVSNTSREDSHIDAILEDAIVEDEDSLSDLSKLQEGQSFNPETGALLGFKDVSRFGTKKCLVLDLDETLVHSSFKFLRTADFVIPVEIDDQVHHVYVIKRPGVDEFLRLVGEWFEVVVFTASVSKYGDPLLDKLDINNAVHHRLFRDSCYNYQGNYIKNLSQMGRPLLDLIIIDNSPASYIFHPQHSVPISSWFSDTHDNELLDLLPLLHDLSKSNVDDISLVLDITL
ncbi:uncharacterized protein KQ657_004090 [Scheffersomyces spartinae]|uniref:FCP1 homology domain-containing protein n=1 Tax=Scheffersomyces spartinae TaxID=45513 RepID=A0A9P7VCV1_9ASCO|nr:uncharacterized protein KQ657_004090 [Scheffersomyces spartinae]KAG7194979.1 hypothetical protein KQ657_004090 [Scheffersomyces spartinae]